jgi:hypothetical protein
MTKKSQPESRTSGREEGTTVVSLRTILYGRDGNCVLRNRVKTTAYGDSTFPLDGESNDLYSLYKIRLGSVIGSIRFEER